MPRHWQPLMTSLLWAERREQDERIKVATDEARARRDLGYQSGNFPLKSKESARGRA